MKARSQRGEETRHRILQTAADLFHQQGVRATSPDEIIERSRTGKGQFYHYFRNKEDLIHQVLQSYLDAIESGNAPLNYELNSWKDLRRWFLAQLELQKRFNMTRGCPFGTIGNEITENDALIRQDLILIFEVVKNKLALFFVKEKSRGRLAKQADAEAMADFCIATIQGAMLMGKIKRNSASVEAVTQEALRHLRKYVPDRRSRRTGSRK